MLMKLKPNQGQIRTQIEIGKRRTCVRKKHCCVNFWPDALAKFSNSEHARGNWLTDGGTNEPTEWLRTKRCWMLHECLSNWPDSKMNKRQTKRLVCLGRTFVVCIRLTCVKVALATAPACPRWRRRTITNKVLSIIMRKAETHTYTNINTYTAQADIQWIQG